MKRGQKRSKAQKRRDARYLRWRTLCDHYDRAVSAACEDWDKNGPSSQSLRVLLDARRFDTLPRPSR